MDSNLKIFQTYYKDEQYDDFHLAKNPNLVKVVNTVKDKYPLAELNPFWSEYVYMKFVFEHLDNYECEYIGFDQYKRHFDYEAAKEIIAANDDVCILGDLGFIDVYKHYCYDHKKKDIDNIIEILKADGFGQRIASHWTAGVVPFFFGSCFIMKKEKFQEMCSFIFSIIDKLDKKYGLMYDFRRYEDYFKKEANKKFEFGKGNSEKTYEYQRRTFGYLLERLVSSWIILNYYTEHKIIKINLINEQKIQN